MCARYNDLLWGEIDLREPLLGELVASAPVQRLRGIRQAGASYYLYPERRANTRFEHSLGVLHILAALGASLEERVAGLLHDVPHTAFSHTVDIVFPSDEHNYHERFQHEVVMRSTIPLILERHQVPLRAALEPHAFPLLEQPLPNLCADRIDYALRDAITAGLATSAEAREFLTFLVPTGQGIAVNDQDAALWFARLFIEANASLWTGPNEAGSYWALAGAIRRGLSTGAFSEADLFLTDDEAMLKLRSSGDDLVNAFLSLLEPGTRFYPVSGSGPLFKAHMKQRVVDPPVRLRGESRLRPLSTISAEYALLLRDVPPQGRIEYMLWSDAIEPALACAAWQRGERPRA